jgi:glucose dehydrogenase
MQRQQTITTINLVSRLKSSALIYSFGFLLAVLFAPLSLSQKAAANGEWPSYGGDLGHTRYSGLSQINAQNFSELELAWSFKTDNLGPRPEYRFQATPLVIDGVMYTTAGSRRAVVALDARTGELLWKYSLNEGERGGAAPRQLSGRGLAFWQQGEDKRVVFVTPGYRLIALNADNGRPLAEFGDNGIVDLKQNADQQIDLVTGEIGLHATPMIAKDVVIVGAAHHTGGNPSSRKNVKGFVRGFDVRTGERLWIFHTIPFPGEYGYESWLEGSAEYTGNTGVWAQISVDEELEIVYLPVEEATGDYYGAYRPGDVPGEWYSPTQPFPTKPPAYDRQGVTEDDLIDFSPELRQQALDVASWYKLGPIFTPPVVSNIDGPLGILMAPATGGGTNWPGGSFDPETNTLYVSSSSSVAALAVVPPYPGQSDMAYIQGNAATGPRTSGGAGSSAGGGRTEFEVAQRERPVSNRGRPPIGLRVQGLPLLKPPYGVISAINMNTGELRWTIPHGQTPDNVRNHPLLQNLDIPRTGQSGSVGTLVTATLLVAGEAQFTTDSEGLRGAWLRAYNKATGAEVGAVHLPAPQTGSPMTYSLDDEQYLVLAVSGTGYSGELRAYKLP